MLRLTSLKFFPWLGRAAVHRCRWGLAQHTKTDAQASVPFAKFAFLAYSVLPMGAPISPVEDTILDIANEVALEHCKSTTWSTWHFWNYYRALHRAGVVAEDVQPASKDIWQATEPFGSCVDIALQTTTALRYELASIQELRHYAGHVRTLARAGCSDEKEYTHCITALLEETFCIVIDFSCHHKAIKIALHSYADSMPYHNMHGDEYVDRLEYLECAEDVRAVRRVPLQPNANPTLFEEFDDQELIRRVNIRIANETEDGHGVLVPKMKSVKLRSFLREAPQLIPWEEFGGKPFAITCRIKVDFLNRKVLMQVPYTDWMLHPENNNLYQRAEGASISEIVNPAACNLVIWLKLPRQQSALKEQIEIMDAIGRKHGLPKGELDKMIDSIYEIWNEGHTAPHPDKQTNPKLLEV